MTNGDAPARRVANTARTSPEARKRSTGRFRPPAAESPALRVTAAPSLRRQALATLGATALQDGLAGTVAHAVGEPVLLLTPAIVRLEGALHLGSSSLLLPVASGCCYHAFPASPGAWATMEKSTTNTGLAPVPASVRSAHDRRKGPLPVGPPADWAPPGPRAAPDKTLWRIPCPSPEPDPILPDAPRADPRLARVSSFGVMVFCVWLLHIQTLETVRTASLMPPEHFRLRTAHAGVDPRPLRLSTPVEGHVENLGA